MKDVFLLKETDQRYFSRLTESFFNAMEAEGIGRGAETFEFTEDQIQRIAKNMPYSPANAVKKWNAATKRPHFSIMVVEKHRPVKNKQENEPLAADEFFITEGTNEQPARKSRYRTIQELYFIRSDKLPTAYPIAPESPAYKLISENLQTMNSDAEIMREIRESLNLAGFYYINLGLFSDTNFVIEACKMLAQGSTPFSIENPLLEVAINTAGNIDGDFPFSTIRQGTATNALTKVKTNRKRNIRIDKVTDTATTTYGDLLVTIPNFSDVAGFRTSTHQLLDALTVALTESGVKSNMAFLPLDEYMKKRGLKNKKEARKQATDDLETLFNAKISFKERRKKGQEHDYHDIRIIDSKGIKKGIINVTFGTVFYNLLIGYPIMPYPAQLWTLNGKHNPNSFYLLRKITEHKNMNVGKKNEDIISVKTLLSATPNLPSYKEVMATDKHLAQRIIEPFERDMDALTDTLTWAYCHSNNTQLTSEELESFSYEKFVSLLVKIEWRNYPDQTTRIEKKAEKRGGNSSPKGG